MRQQRIAKSPRRRRAVEHDAPTSMATAPDTSAAEDLLERIDDVLEVV